MKELAALFESPTFVPISIGVGCSKENLITVTKTADDIEESLRGLLQKVKHVLRFDD